MERLEMNDEQMGKFIRMLSDDECDFKVEEEMGALEPGERFTARANGITLDWVKVKGKTPWAALEALAAKMEAQS